MSLQRIYIGAGTNQGDRLENLAFAAQMLQPTVKIRRVSPIYQTEPWGYTDQPDFLNLVFEAETTLPPMDLLAFLKSIERRMGRQENFRYGPRIIDLDILLYGEQVLETETLTIPHLQLHNRLFVLKPLVDLIPEKVHPLLNKPLAVLLESAPTERLEKLSQPFNGARTIFRWGHKSYLMGIINLTRDSFSKDGILSNVDETITKALSQAAAFLAAGADILDLGAESTRPGFIPVKEDTEIKTLVPVIQALKETFPEATLSIDTRKAAVAEVALTAGADWINDVGGGIADPKMASICAEADCPFVVMRHQPLDKSISTIDQVVNELQFLKNYAVDKGVREEKLILDPGIGFGTSPWQCVEIMRNLKTLKIANLPMLVGTSRKSFIGHFLQREVEARLGGTAATVTAALLNGADIVRVHDVELVTDLIRMTDLLCR